MSSTVELSVIVVTYNTREMTLECLRVLIDATQGMHSEVLLVDNASSDGTAGAIRETFPQVRIIVNERNAGFGAANNQAMKEARGDFLLLLNSDAFPKGDAIAVLMEFLRKNPCAGLVGPRVLNADGTLQVSCYPFPSPGFAWLENLWLSRGYSRWAHDSVRQVDFVIGACMLLRRQVYEEVGGFDERFFMYAEEADWQRRMQNIGWKTVFVPSACVTHLGGASGANEKATINRHFFDSLDIYQRKHHGIAGWISLRCAMATGCLLRALLWAVASLRPRLRATALSKFRLHSWLFIRQTTYWSVGFEKRL